MDIYVSRINPMLLTETAKPFDDSDFLFEMKFDGTRALIYVDSQSIRIYNKRNIFLNDTYPELLNIKNQVKMKCIFDGEIIVDDNGKPSFKKLQNRALLKDKLKIKYIMKTHPVTFICYDILYEGKDLTNLSLLERKKILEKYEDTEYFIKSKYIFERGKDFYKVVKKLDLEGIVAKRIDSLYYPGKRSKDWIKIKNWYDEDFYICGYDESSADITASLVIGRMNTKGLVYVGRVVIGKKNPDFAVIKKVKKLSKSPILNYNDANIIYVEPVLQCTVEFIEKTKGGHLRQPNYKGLRID